MHSFQIPEKLKPFLKVEYVLLAILLLAIAIRFSCLDLKLFHHDEAIHAWYSYQLMTTGEYMYDPTYHGPFLYYITSAMFSLFGDSDLVGRILPYVFGCALIPLLYWIYRMRFLNGKVVCIASLFIAVSPMMVYFTRFLRNDIFIIFFSLLLIAAMLAWMTKKKWYWLVLAGIAAAFGVCSKENMPIIIVTFAVFFLYLLWSKKFTLPKNWGVHLLAAVVVFFAIVFTMYTSFWAHPEMALSAGPMALSHWAEAHAEQRLGGPAVYYFGLFILYEIPILLLAIWGIFRFFCPKKTAEERLKAAEEKAERKAQGSPFLQKLCGIFRRPAEAKPVNREEEFIFFAIFWLIISLITYAYLGEKVPWLSLHQLLPMIIVAAFGLTMVKKGLVQIIVAIAAIVCLCTVMGATVYNPDDICGPIVQVQNSEELRPLLSEIDKADKVAILYDGAAWPLLWYLRDVWSSKITNFGALVPRGTAESGKYDVLIAHDLESYDSLKGYDKRFQRLHYWFDAIGTGGSGIGAVWNWIRFYFTRDGAYGSLNIAVYTRSTG
ncbi:MAG TPA: TIGR03663 family protein [Methanocorpusculum sp.]|nr:TIGR03663 family protein [Methanocorpusculum sp.]